METFIRAFRPEDVIILPLPDGLSIGDVPREFLGLMDHVDERGAVHVIVQGPAPNDFTQCVFLKRSQ
jgi:hypothetical protein